ncbi:hypothetical protein FDECE_13196 [Fusarium decemcellulare]|nr:hypothetical protein FDECE_13196 [Fusarium decemcellulare]
MRLSAATDYHLSKLPCHEPEIWHQICALLPKYALFHLRLVSRVLSDIALPWVYRSIFLEGYGDSAERFNSIAKTPKLRDLVREVTIDTWIGPTFRYNSNRNYRIPGPFLDALPYLCCYDKITTLHIGFSEHCGDEDRNHRGTAMEETWSFRYRVLDSVFHCVAGMWTAERQMAIDRKAAVRRYTPEYPEHDLSIHLGQVLPIKELIISNLADYNDPNLLSSEAWKKVLSLPTLIDLKLLIATETDEPAPEHTVYFEEKYAMMGDLPFTWLSPVFSENLRDLSLYYAEYWGWFPKMDFRLLGDSPFPRLKVLALGNYVFSHEWQVDWFASVGQQNGSGGLEELYLDDCPILFKARQRGPLDIEDPGYPLVSNVLDVNRIKETRNYRIRWHHVLSRWARSMGALRVFRMGSGSWSASGDTLNSIMRDEPYSEIHYATSSHRYDSAAHRNFAGPEPLGPQSVKTRKEIWATTKYLYGAGMSLSRADRLQYVEYNIGMACPYLEITPGDPRIDPEIGAFAPEKETLAKDDTSYEAHLAAVRARMKIE